MLDKLAEKYAEINETIALLPTNNKDNRNKKIQYLNSHLKEIEQLKQKVVDEINGRFNKIEQLNENPQIKELNKELEKCSIINEWNKYNTPYEKMHLDYYLYQLSKYYKEDLVSVNACIRKIIESFKKVEIEIKSDDFSFNDYSKQYIAGILKNVDDVSLMGLFESIYWQFPEIIKTIEINFKNIYLKYESRIIKYYEDRHHEFLQNHTDDEIKDMIIKLNSDIFNLQHIDIHNILKNFEDKVYNVNDYAEMELEKKKRLFFGEDGNPDITTLLTLYTTLNEYDLLIKYKFFLNDMKERLAKKDEYKGTKDKALKEIVKDEKTLISLNAKKNKKNSLFGKAKNDEKLLFDYNETLNSLIEKYKKFNDDRFNDLIYRDLSKDSSILEVFNVVTSNYLYFVDLYKKEKENEEPDIKNINMEFNALKRKIVSNKFSIINNIALLDDKPMKQLISDRFKMENISLSIDSLEPENLGKTINDVFILLNAEFIKQTTLTYENIKFYLNVLTFLRH